jgi:hypothetical protein
MPRARPAYPTPAPHQTPHTTSSWQWRSHSVQIWRYHGYARLPLCGARLPLPHGYVCIPLYGARLPLPCSSSTHPDPNPRLPLRTLSYRSRCPRLTVNPPDHRRFPSHEELGDSCPLLHRRLRYNHRPVIRAPLLSSSPPAQPHPLSPLVASHLSRWMGGIARLWCAHTARRSWCGDELPDSSAHTLACFTSLHPATTRLHRHPQGVRPRPRPRHALNAPPPHPPWPHHALILPSMR